MEPFSMMIGYGLINSLSQLVIRPITDKISRPDRLADMQRQMESKHVLDLEAVRYNKTLDFELQEKLQETGHLRRIKEAQCQFQNQLALWQSGQFDSKVWPLKTPLGHGSLSKFEYNENSPAFINVFLTEPVANSIFGRLVQTDLKNDLTQFVQVAYGADSQHHPCMSRIGDWKANFNDSSNINALWYGMKGQPTIVINPIPSSSGDKIDLNISMWGLGENSSAPTTNCVFKGPLGKVIAQIAREESKIWKEHGLPIESAQLKQNVKLLDQEQAMIEAGKGEFINDLLDSYTLPQEIHNKVVSRFVPEFSHLVACLTGLYADIYHLIEYGTKPYMPYAIINHNNKFQIPEIVIEGYRKTLTNMVLTNYLEDKLPYAIWGVAESLSYDEDSSLSIFNDGVALWANKKVEKDKDVAIPESIDGSLRLLKDMSTNEDKSYLKYAQHVLESMGRCEEAKTLEKRESELVLLPQESQCEECEWEVVKKETFTDVDFKKWIAENECIALENNAEYALMAFRDTYFVMLFLDKNAKVIKSRTLTGQCVLANRYCFSEGTMEDTFSIYTIKTAQFISIKALMDKDAFNSFERFAKQLDTKMSNLGKLTKPYRVGDTNENIKHGHEELDFYQQLTDIFAQGQYLSLESEKCEVANFSSIQEWIANKLPVKDAVNAHILKTKLNNNIMLCIFFSDQEVNALIGNNYPMKRVICDKCDSDIEVFLNGLLIGTINL